MCIEKAICDMEEELKDIIDQKDDFSKDQYHILICILELFETKAQDIFMEGYKYAISILEDGIINKK